jgi:hypothetical protein
VVAGPGYLHDLHESGVNTVLCDRGGAPE